MKNENPEPSNKKPLNPKPEQNSSHSMVVESSE